MRTLLSFSFICCSLFVYAQEKSLLSVEQIMRDPKWMGVSPDEISWNALDGQLYFRWNPERLPYNNLYRISPGHDQPEKLPEKEAAQVVSDVQYSRDGQQAVYVKNGDLFIKNIKSNTERQLCETVEEESHPQFGSDETAIFFQRGRDIYRINRNGEEQKQLTHFVVRDEKEKKEGKGSVQNQWLKQQQTDLFDVLKSRKREAAVQDSLRKLRKKDELKELPLEEGAILRHVGVSPNGSAVVYLTYKPARNNSRTIVPNYVTESGYTEDIPGRPKVGEAPGLTKGFLYDRQKDTIYAISVARLEGIRDIPAYYQDYPKQRDSLLALKEDRKVSLSAIHWNPSGTQAIIIAYALDHKDRWIAQLDLQNGQLLSLDRQHDDAWIAGPGIGGGWGGGTVGWIDDERFYFQSEASGYSHLYTVNVQTKEKKQLTSGKFEIQRVVLSRDKKTFYITANKKHPGITHFYRMAVSGGALQQITSMDGGNEVNLSPDEKWLAIRYSSSNTPWELYLQENKPGAKAKQITESRSDEFKAYPWRKPEVIAFANRYGDSVHARLYVPEKPKASRPAVVFVHGAGYLQNVHYWWSSYFREYMFNNLLTDLGYTVLDIDYTGSAGYGRNFRTGIYRHMGGKDLTDQVDGVKLLVDKYGVNPKNVGLYGGSYGGFITLMALFTEPEVFTAGAGLRSVTDWAHYNHGYTSAILNEPFTDPKAYAQSSPINFAEGLKGYLLMCHGMVDENVHFQDIVRLNQRLIELGKKNWSLAVYPVEDHGFVEPSSWTDEYSRILQLFEERLNN